MTVITPPRTVRLTTRLGTATPRFASFLDDTVEDLNDLTDGVSLAIVEDSDQSVTFESADAFTVRRKISGSLGQKYTIPSLDDLDYELGTWIEIYNDTGVELQIEASVDRLESTEAGVVEGIRTMGESGWGRLVLIDIETVTWKINGDQIT